MKDKLKKKICNICHKYWPSEAVMKQHKKSHKKETAERVNKGDMSDEIDSENEAESKTINGHICDNIAVIENIFDLFKSPLVDS